MFRDTLELDSTYRINKLSINQFDFHCYDKKFCVLGRTDFNDELKIKTYYFNIDFKNGSFNYDSIPFKIYTFYKNGFVIGELEKDLTEPYNPIIKKLYYYDIEEKNKKLILDLSNILTDQRTIIGVYYNIVSNSFLIESGIKDESVFYLELKCFKYNVLEDTIQDYVNKYYSKNRFAIHNSWTIKALDNKNEFHNRGYLIDSLKFSEDILKIIIDVKGINVYKNNIVSYNFATYTDTYFPKKRRQEATIISYKLTYKQEKAFYNVVNDNIITDEVIARFSLGELDLLEKMIYAKHNQYFEEKYYQALFNLYAFYRENRESRLKGVEHLFTETDKINLQTIRKAKQKFVE